MAEKGKGKGSVPRPKREEPTEASDAVSFRCPRALVRKVKILCAQREMKRVDFWTAAGERHLARLQKLKEEGNAEK